MKTRCKDIIMKEGEFYSSIQDVLDFRPNVIITIPPRDYNSSNTLTIMKILTGAIIISMMSEGYHSLEPDDVQMANGYNLYSDKLIDYYIMWGPKTSRVLGQNLLKDGKLSDIRRVKSTGYIAYETSKMQKIYRKTNYYQKIHSWKDKYQKNVLVITGFTSADSNIKELLALGFFRNKTKFKELTEKDISFGNNIIRMESKFREKYIEDVEEAAKKYTNIGFIIKLHPIEISRKTRYYDRLAQYNNILVIKEAIPIGMLLGMVDVMVHYNSTSNNEAYISNIPTIQRYAEPEDNLITFGWQKLSESTEIIDINDREGFMRCILNDLRFQEISNMNHILYDYFGWKQGKKYQPTIKISNIILKATKKQKLCIYDKRVRSALNSNEAKVIIKNLKSALVVDVINNNYKKSIQKIVYLIYLCLIRKVIGNV